VRFEGVGGLVPPAPPAPAAVEDKTVMSLVDHLSELRRRIGISLLAVALGTVVGFFFAAQLITFLKAPLNLGKPLVYTGLGDAFFINLKIAIVVGIVLAMPVLLWQLWAFISPGLTREERRLARPWVPLALAFFVIGVVVAYVILPFASTFLLSFSSADLQPLITAESYFDFVTTLFLVFGLIMQFPIILFALSRVGIVTSAKLSGARRQALLGMTIFAAVITPGGDLVSPIALLITMYTLFEGTIFVIRRTGR